MRIAWFASLLILAAIATASAPQRPGQNANSVSPKTTSAQIQDRSAQLLEGEQRFRTNCGRCHMPPHKFPPRMMATIIRHMRARATLTDEDMRLILKYMTQ